MPDVGILIKAKDEASGAIKNVKSSLNDLGKSAGDATSLSGAFTQLGGAIGIAAAAVGAFKVGQVVVDLAQVGAQAQRVEVSFGTLTRQAGISGDALLAAMQKASSGTIANTELMLTANRALALGVADSADEMSQLMQVAIARGKALGLSAQQAFNDLVTGIGRMSPLILDNLGIITGGEKVFNDYAAGIGRRHHREGDPGGVRGRRPARWAGRSPGADRRPAPSRSGPGPRGRVPVVGAHQRRAEPAPAKEP